MAVGSPGEQQQLRHPELGPSVVLAWCLLLMSASVRTKIYKHEQKPSVQFVIKWFPVSGGGAPVVVSVVPGVS